MSDETEYTWRVAEAEAHTAAAEAFAYAVANGDDLDDSYDAAHEYADGTAWVIYTYRARCLWMDSREVQDAESELDGCIEDDADIDRRITLCVFHALAAAFAEKWRELAEAHDGAEVAA